MRCGRPACRRSRGSSSVRGSARCSRRQSSRHCARRRRVRAPSSCESRRCVRHRRSEPCASLSPTRASEASTHTLRAHFPRVKRLMPTEAGSPTILGGLATVDWLIVAGGLLATTLLGLVLGRGATIREFFLGGRKLPWWAVSASIVATEISALTLVGVPFVVYRPGGNFAYLQLVLIGSVIA